MYWAKRFQVLRVVGRDTGRHYFEFGGGFICNWACPTSSNPCPRWSPDGPQRSQMVPSGPQAGNSGSGLWLDICLYIYIYISIYIYNLEEGPPFGGEDHAHIPVRLAPSLIVLNMVETSMFPWRRSWFFCTFGTHTRWENHKWYVSIGRRWRFPLVLSFYTFFMFSGTPPLGYDALLCF